MKLEALTRNWTQGGVASLRVIPATGGNHPPLVITPAIEYELAQLQKTMRQIARMVCSGPAPADTTHDHEYDCGECASCAAREALQ